MTQWLKQIQGAVVDVIFPRECIGCGKYGHFICPNCAKKLHRLYPPLCLKCGKPETSGTLCAECWGKKAAIDEIRSVYIFEGTIRLAIHQFKYNNLRAIAHSLAEYMADYYLKGALSGDILIPVPVHERRLKERGYNQSALLAIELSNMISLPADTNILKRIRESQPQARSSNIQERKNNMENAFICSGAKIQGKDIIVIDDVSTSGATLEACAVALKASGAKHVLGFTLAREI